MVFAYKWELCVLLWLSHCPVLGSCNGHCLVTPLAHWWTVQTLHSCAIWDLREFEALSHSGPSLPALEAASVPMMLSLHPGPLGWSPGLWLLEGFWYSSCELQQPHFSQAPAVSLTQESSGSVCVRSPAASCTLTSPTLGSRRSLQSL